MHLCASRFPVDTRHEQGVVVGVDMADGGDDGEAYGVAVQGSPGGASPDTAAAACRRVKCNRLGAVDRTTWELLTDRGGELTAEVHVLIGPTAAIRATRVSRRAIARSTLLLRCDTVHATNRRRYPS
jgi:hypothetical protein